MFLTFKTIDGLWIQTANYTNIAKFEVMDLRKTSIGKSIRSAKITHLYTPHDMGLTIVLTDKKANKPKTIKP